MIRIFDIFSGQAARKAMDADALIAFAKSESDPEKINQAMMQSSKNVPYWPNDPKLIRFFIEAKKDLDLDAKLVSAALLSASVRQAMLNENRIADREGAFTHFIYADPAQPENSTIFKLRRSTETGGGTGAFGGLREKEDIDISHSVNREVYEEVSDAMRLKVRLYGSQELEERLDMFIHESAVAKEAPDIAFKKFIDSLQDHETLQKDAKEFVDRAESLIEDLIKAPKTRLFKCRDDHHAITRGWGFHVDAYAHVSALSKQTAEKMIAFQKAIADMAAKAKANGVSATAGEMQGIESYTLAQAAEKIKDSHYGHEGLAEIIGFGILLQDSLKNKGLREWWEKCEQSGAIASFAKKMQLRDHDLRQLYEKTLRDPHEGYLSPPDAAYKAAIGLGARVATQSFKKS